MKYSVVANQPIKLPDNVRAYLKRQVALRKRKGTLQYKAELARKRRLKALSN